eukprot:TRINITY_DN12573_c0_g1_i2.p1 TRINITY_DN12573_c0_g1~~TRINITY_DN12573_c0_g1_i2.p1  ORF type:complete len:382 (+),score=117.63 TRINITY_DN12573_c0_g1_i2:66-1148(+)
MPPRGAFRICGLAAGSAAGYLQTKTQTERPLCTFGVIADVQYADADDAMDFSGRHKRHYRGALAELKHAVSYWSGWSDGAGVDFVVQLGDLLDERNRRSGQSEAAAAVLLNVLSGVNAKVYHVIGNHELYNFTRKRLNELLDTAPAPRGKEFYSFVPHPRVRMIVLDAFQESLMGYDDAEDPRRARAVEFLQAHNPNDVFNDGDWCAGLPDDKRHCVPYNGGLGAEQLQWLRAELSRAAQQNQRVVVFSHGLLHPKACSGSTMVWDWQEALDICSKSGVVTAVLCGHDHHGGYCWDSNGMHHITFQSPLNKGESATCYGVAELHWDRLDLLGPGLGDLMHSTALSGGRKGDVRSFQLLRA